MKKRLLLQLAATLALTGMTTLAQAQTTPIKFILDWRFEGPAALFLARQVISARPTSWSPARSTTSAWNP